MGEVGGFAFSLTLPLLSLPFDRHNAATSNPPTSPAIKMSTLINENEWNQE